MRSEESWDQIKSRYFVKFPPRIQKDLQKIKDIKSINNHGKSVFIHGGVDTGKTLMAANMLMDELKNIYLKAIPNAHNSTIFVSFPEMLEEIKQGYGNKMADVILKKYLTAHFLVIDDFLTTKPTDWVLETIYYLVNYRYEHMLTTVITSNFNLEELEKALGDQRIPSRIGRSYMVIKKKEYK